MRQRELGCSLHSLIPVPLSARAAPRALVKKERQREQKKYSGRIHGYIRKMIDTV